MKKDAGVAAVLNTILPGLGWIYVEQIAVGIISLFINSGLIYGCLFAVSFSSHGQISDYRSMFSIVFLVYWILQINVICYFVNKEKDKTHAVSNRQSLQTEEAFKGKNKSFLNSLLDNLRE